MTKKKTPDNRFYTYQFNDYNLALFNLRTRSLNALLYWLSQIFGSGLFGLLLDYERAFKRQQRAGLGWAILTAVIFLVWGFGWDVQKDYERGSLATKMDWNDSGYLGRVWLYIFYGVTDSMWQTYAYWIMGMLADDPRDLAPLVGFYKGVPQFSPQKNQQECGMKFLGDEFVTQGSNRRAPR